MTDRNINIVMIAPSLGIGGAERQVIDPANGLSTDRFHTAFFVSPRNTRILVEKIHYCGAPPSPQRSVPPRPGIRQSVLACGDGQKSRGTSRGSS